MRKIKLETSSGGHVGHSEIPPFTSPPDVLVWGERFFKMYADNEEDGVWIYRECFTVFVVAPVME